MQKFKNMSKGDRIFDVVNIVILTILTVIFIYPMWHCLMASFSDPGKLLTEQHMLLVPNGFSLKGYQAVMGNAGIWIGYKNTIFYMVVGTLINMILTILGAYVLSRQRMMLKRALLFFVTLTMYINAGLIPLFLVVKGLGLYNSRWAILLPVGVSTYNLIVMRTSFAHIPRALEESAMMDGAGDLTILFRILLPVSKATLAVMVLFYAVSHWNSWFSASIYLQDRKLFPLQLYLREILIANSTAINGEPSDPLDGLFYLEELIKYCTIIVSTVPILAAYPFAQKYFVSGVMLGSLKE